MKGVEQILENRPIGGEGKEDLDGGDAFCTLSRLDFGGYTPRESWAGPRRSSGATLSIPIPDTRLTTPCLLYTFRREKRLLPSFS